MERLIDAKTFHTSGIAVITPATTMQIRADALIDRTQTENLRTQLAAPVEVES